jgi:hypothetical protein
MLFDYHFIKQLSSLQRESFLTVKNDWPSTQMFLQEDYQRGSHLRFGAMPMFWKVYFDFPQ